MYLSIYITAYMIGKTLTKWIDSIKSYFHPLTQNSRKICEVTKIKLTQSDIRANVLSLVFACGKFKRISRNIKKIWMWFETENFNAEVFLSFSAFLKILFCHRRRNYNFFCNISLFLWCLSSFRFVRSHQLMLLLWIISLRCNSLNRKMGQTEDTQLRHVTSVVLFILWYYQLMKLHGLSNDILFGIRRSSGYGN